MEAYEYQDIALRVLGTYSVFPSSSPRDIDKKIPGQTDEQLPGVPYLAVVILMQG